MNTVGLLRCSTMALVALTAVLRAEDDFTVPEPSPYPMRSFGYIELGAAVITDFDAIMSGVTTNGSWSQNTTLSLSPGFAVNGGFGDSLGRWVTVEFLAGILYNNVDTVTGPSGDLGPVDGSLMQVPLMLNIAVQAPLKGPVQPFVGAGAGAVISWLDIQQTVQVGSGDLVTLDGSSTEYNFAYQFFGGVRYRLSQDARVTLTYRFQGCVSPTWSLDSAYYGGTAATLKASDIYAQSLMLGFQASF